VRPILSFQRSVAPAADPAVAASLMAPQALGRSECCDCFLRTSCEEGGRSCDQ